VLAFYWGPGEGDGELLFTGCRVSARDDEQDVMVVQHCEHTQYLRGIHLYMIKMVSFTLCIAYYNEK
jgi:hypothetical protein